MLCTLSFFFLRDFRVVCLYFYGHRADLVSLILLNVIASYHSMSKPVPDGYANQYTYKMLPICALRPCFCFGLDNGDDAGSGHFAWYEGPYDRCDGAPGTGHRAAGHSSSKTLESLIFGAQHVKLHFHAGVLRGKLLHLLLKLCLLFLQLLLLCDTFDAAAGSIATVFECAPPLFQLQDFLFGQTAQVLVQLSHRHGHQLIIRETRAILTWLSLHLQRTARDEIKREVREGRAGETRGKCNGPKHQTSYSDEAYSAHAQ